MSREKTSTCRGQGRGLKIGVRGGNEVASGRQLLLFDAGEIGGAAWSTGGKRSAREWTSRRVVTSKPDADVECAGV